MNCTNCNTQLERIQTLNGIFYSCNICGGRMVTIPVLKRENIHPEILRQIQSKKHEAPTDFSKKCPQCNMAMKRLSIPMEQQQMELEFCQHCFSIWFDKAEHENLPRITKAEPATPKLHPDSVKAMAMADVRAHNFEREVREEAERREKNNFFFVLSFLGW